MGTDLLKEREITFKFTIGDFLLYKHKFNLLVADCFLNYQPTQLVPKELLSKANRAVDGIVLRSFPTNQRVSVFSYEPGVIRYVPSQYCRYYVRFQGNFEQYIKKLKKRSRKSLTQRVRRFEERSGGQIKWRKMTLPLEMEQFQKIARKISEKTYQERLLGVGLANDEKFKREMRELASTGRARGYLLYLDNEPIAFIYRTIKDGVVSAVRTGYIPAYKEWSPGIVLQYLALKSLFDEGMHKILDFGMGESYHKKLLATDFVNCADIYYFNRTSSNLLLLKVHALVDSFSHEAGALAESLGVKSKIKRLIRG